MIATGGFDGRINIFNTETSTLDRMFLIKGKRICALSFSLDNKKLAYLTRDYQFGIIDLTSGEFTIVLPSQELCREIVLLNNLL